MKAKDYARLYNKIYTEKDEIEAMKEVLSEFFQEGLDLIDERGITTDWGLMGIIKEMDKKWRAFARIIGDDHINVDGYKLFLQRLMPELHDFVWGKKN